MTKNEIEVFENFLKRNGVLTEFKAMCSIYQKDGYKSYVNHIPVARAFGWAFKFDDAEKSTMIPKYRWQSIHNSWKTVADTIIAANVNSDECANTEEDETESDASAPEELTSNDTYIMHTFDTATGRKLMADDEVEISTTSGYRFIVNPALGETLRRLKLNKLSIREDSITGEMHLVFNKSQGVTASESEMKADKSGVRFNSKPLVEFLAKRFGITSKKHKLKIGDNQSRTADYYVCKVYNE